ncbi:MAG: hypothetical protein M3R27_14955 [Bacteroidota bacterium]|nr:hypothetical protein [Bacteroidota bacterium]
MKKTFLAFFCVLFVFHSCKKKNDPDDCPTPAVSPITSSGMPMSVGSYWVYESTTVDTNGVNSPMSGSNDSCYFSGDTIINGNLFFIYISNYGAWETYRRDSLGYIVDQKGDIHYSATNFTDTLHTESVPGFFYISYLMADPGAPVNVPAGSFACKDFLGTAILYPSTYPWDNPRYLHNYYSPGIGLVKDVRFYYSNPSSEERRLLRYHIEP